VANAVPQRQSLKTLTGESESKDRGDIVVRREGCLLFITERFRLVGISESGVFGLGTRLYNWQNGGVFLLDINSSM